MNGQRRLLAAPDKFRGSLTASEVAEAICAGAGRAGWAARSLPLADGGEGTLEAFGGPNRCSTVTGPLGAPVDAPWRLSDGLAVIEGASAAGLSLAGGAAGNDPVGATTRGVGELIAAAIDAGAERIIVGVGGTATTDGGLGAVEALDGRIPLRVPVVVACDVETRFVDAARVFALQKGATPEQVPLLTMRLARLATIYRSRFGTDVATAARSGAAGGLAGGLAAIGAELAPGFELIAENVGLDAALAESDVVVTGEGKVDATSFRGKVVGGVLSRAAHVGVQAFVVAGDVVPRSVLPEAWSLLDEFGQDRAWEDTQACVADVVSRLLRTGIR